MYRIRREVFLREADALGLDPRTARVLDVGSGTGFYIRRWLELGVGSITGCDLTESAVDRLRSRDAVHHFARLVRPGGHVLLSENFVHGQEQRSSRQVNRTTDTIEGVLRSAGLEPVRRVPVLVLMNAHVDASRMRRKAWGAFLRGVTLTRPTGWLAGAALFPAERRPVRRVRESPTTELLVCRRPLHS
jgi:SAM-dependent methyltransferase